MNIETHHTLTGVIEPDIVLEDKEGREGYMLAIVTRYNVLWHGGQFFAPGAFDKFLESEKWKERLGIVLNCYHCANSPVGRFINFFEDGDKLMGEALFSMNSTAGRDSYGLVVDKALNGLSVEVTIHSTEYPASTTSRWRAKHKDVMVTGVGLTNKPAIPTATVRKVLEATKGASIGVFLPNGDFVDQEAVRAVLSGDGQKIVEDEDGKELAKGGEGATGGKDDKGKKKDAAGAGGAEGDKKDAPVAEKKEGEEKTDTSKDAAATAPEGTIAAKKEEEKPAEAAPATAAGGGGEGGKKGEKNVPPEGTKTDTKGTDPTGDAKKLKAKKLEAGMSDKEDTAEGKAETDDESGAKSAAPTEKTESTEGGNPETEGQQRLGDGSEDEGKDGEGKTANEKEGKDGEEKLDAGGDEKGDEGKGDEGGEESETNATAVLEQMRAFRENRTLVEMSRDLAAIRANLQHKGASKNA